MSSFNRANIKDDTVKYVGDLCTLIANPYQKSVSGKMVAPSTAGGSAIYISEGSGTVSCDSSTKSAVAFYDAEASLRRGQPAVIVYERNAAGSVTFAHKINIGRPSSDFLAGGIVSSTLTSANTSGLDDIAGSQTQAVLYSTPKVASALTATDVLQFTTDKDMHLVSNISSKADNTRTFAITEHTGNKSSVLSTGARSNQVEIEYTVSATNNAAQGFADPSTLFTQVTGSYASNSAAAIYDSARDLAYSPFSLASYVSHLSLNVPFIVQTAAIETATLTVVALDAAGGALETVDVAIDLQSELSNTNTPGDFDFALDVNLTSSTLPIDRVMVFLKNASNAAGDVTTGQLKRSSAVASGRIAATEETADIAGRPVHFTVFEGLNASASLNFHAANILAGTPDSTNAFISGGASSDEVYDFSMVQNMLLTFRHTFPRAYTGMGAEVANIALRAWFDMEGMDVALEARSFKKIGKTIKKILKGAKKARTTASKIADISQPILDEGGMLLASGAFGPQAQMLGGGMLAASEGIDKGRKYGVLE